jgi:Uma2 family endonuclease
MQQPARKHYTPAEYLTREDAADYKSEYYQGEIFAMAGGSINHNRIVGNLHGKMNRAILSRNCEAFMNEMKVWIEAEQLFTYPDILVICGKPQFYEVSGGRQRSETRERGLSSRFERALREGGVQI